MRPDERLLEKAYERLRYCSKAYIYDPTNPEQLLGEVQIAYNLDGHIVAHYPDEMIWPDDLPDGDRTSFSVTFCDARLGLISSVVVFGPAYHYLHHCTSRRCEQITVIRVEQRRQDVKVATQLDASLQRTKRDKPETVHIYNISAGGVYFGCPAQLSLSVGSEHLLLLPVGQHRTLELRLQILRCEALKQKSARSDWLGYGCKFVNLETKAETALRNFVFQLDREQRRSHRQND